MCGAHLDHTPLENKRQNQVQPPSIHDVMKTSGLHVRKMMPYDEMKDKKSTISKKKKSTR